VKVLFVPYYFYIQYPVFKPVICCLLDQGVDARLLVIPRISPRDESEEFGTDRFQRDCVPYSVAEILRPDVGVQFVLPVRLLNFIRNAYRLYQLLRRERPSALVIGSHHGGIYIRVLQILSSWLNIKVYSLFTIAVRPNRLTVASTPIRALLDPLVTCAFWPLANRYVARVQFLVPGEALCRFLLDEGISRESISVVGNPAHDALVRARRQFGEGDLVVVLVTEVIQERYGQQYLKTLLEMLRSIFESVPSLKVRVRYHPREPEAVVLAYKQALQGRQFDHRPSEPLEMSLAGALASIGHFSGALDASIILGIPVIALSSFAEKSRRFYPDATFLDCSNATELKAALLRLNDPLRWAMDCRSAMVNYTEHHAQVTDGSSALRVSRILNSPLSNA
jgi:hypothetical protein